MGSAFLCNLLYFYGIIRTGWRSFKLLKTTSAAHNPLLSVTKDISLVIQEETERKLKMKEALHFYAVISAITIYDYYFEFLISFWMPFYYTIKFIILIWVVVPEAKGATVLFTNVLYPRLKKHEYFIETVVLPFISILSKNVLLFGDKLLFNAAAKNILSDVEIARLCETYESRVAELRNLLLIRKASNANLLLNEQLEKNKQDRMLMSTIQTEVSSTGTYMKWVYDQIQPVKDGFVTVQKAKVVQDETRSKPTSSEAKYAEVVSLENTYRQTQSSSGWIGFGFESVVSLANNTKNLFLGSSIQTEVGTMSRVNETNKNIAVDVEMKQSDEGKNVSEEGEFDALLDEFDESDNSTANTGSYLRQRKGNGIRRYATNQTNATIESSQTQNEDEDDQEDDSGDGMWKHNEKSKKKYGDSSKDKVERISLHRPKRNNKMKLSEDRKERERIQTRSQVK